MSNPSTRPAAAVPRLVLTGVLLLLGGLVAVPGVAAAGPTIRIGDGLDPVELRIRPGTTVTFRNVDGQRHRLRSRAGAEFDTGNLEPGGSRTIRFAVEGRYPYVDERDRDATAYHGTIVVTSSGSTGSSGGSTGSGGGATSGGATGGGAASARATISFAGRRFSPGTVTVSAGAVVTFRNDDDREHTATARGGAFDTGVLGAGASRKATLSTPGTFRYLCLIHPDMTGTIVVKGASGGAAAPAGPKPTLTPRPTAAASPAPTAGGTPGAIVSVVDFAFAPASIGIAAGSTLTFRNDGVAPHTATTSDGSVDSGRLDPGATFRATLGTPGAVRFVCAFHPQMTLEVRVTAAATPPQTTEPAATPTTDPSPSASEASAEPSVTPGATILEAGAPGAPPADAGTPGDRPVSATVDPGFGGRLLLVVLLGGVAIAAFARLVTGLGRRATAPVTDLSR